MSDVFISYARSTLHQAQQVAEGLRSLGYNVWWDDDLPSHRAYAEVIEERLRGAKAVVVIWSADAAKSQWVRAEADVAREAGTLVQMSIDGSDPPLPFNQLQCADMGGWDGDLGATGWLKVTASVANLVGAAAGSAPVPQAPQPVSTKPSIAVLPFANLTGDTAQEYFAEGMVEEITTALSRIRSIFVIGSSSSFSFKGSSITPREAARKLGVRYVLEGSVRRADGRVRIAVRLIDGAEGSQKWAERFEDDLACVFALQDKVATSVAGILEPAVEAAEFRRVAKRPTESLSSYDLYLRAGAVMRTRKQSEVVEALELLTRAVTLDPDYGVALAYAANCHSLLIPLCAPEEAGTHRLQATELAQRALRCADDDPQVLTTVALTVLNVRQDLEAALALMDRALSLNAGSSSSWHISGLMRTLAGDASAAIEHLETSLRLDPLSHTRFELLAWIGLAQFEQGFFVEAAGQLSESALLEPEYRMSHAVLAACCGHLGDVLRAQEALSQYASLSSSDVRSFAKMLRRAEHQALYLQGIDLAEAMATTAAGVGPMIASPSLAPETRH